jgi:hypothetical protein
MGLKMLAGSIPPTLDDRHISQEPLKYSWGSDNPFSSYFKLYAVRSSLHQLMLVTSTRVDIVSIL